MRAGTQRLVVMCILVASVVICSCKREGLLLNEKHGKLDLSVFVLRQIATYGGSATPADVATILGITNYVYSEDKDGFQVVCEGNQVAALRITFQQRFGDPALVKTNADGITSFVYSVRQTGLAITCGLDRRMVNGTPQELTHLVAVREVALK